MKIVAGEGKKERNFRRSGGGGVGRGGVQRRRSQEERPNLGRTHENFEHTPHRHTTPQHNTPQHNTTTTTRHTTHRRSRTGWSWAREGPSQGGLWPQNQDMSNKLSRRAAPLAKVFGVKDGSQRFGHKMVSKVVRAKCGQKNQKIGKTNQKRISLSPSPKK